MPNAPVQRLPDRAGRRAVVAAFAVNGAMIASWVVRIPDVRTEFALSEATLGAVLLAMSCGVVGSLPVAGGLVPRLGSRRVLAVGALTAALALAAAPWAPSTALLAVALFGLGAGSSAMDVGMNAQGIGVEATYERSIMVGLHAAWSVGTLLGAGIGALAVAARVPLTLHLGAAAGLLVVVTAIALPWLRVVDRAHRARGEPAPGARLALPRGPLIPIAVVALGATIGEHAGSDWSGLVMGDVVGVGPRHVAWGYVAVTAAMTVARLVGDRVADRLGAAATIRWGGWLAGAGFLLVVTVPVVPVALVAFLAVGAGVAAIVPLAFAAAGRVARSAGEGVAAAATVGYGGFLVAPPLIGLLAERFDLRVAMVAVAIAVVACTNAVGRLPAAGERADDRAGR